MAPMPARYHLAPRPAGRAVAPDLDASQRSVVAHPGGPLLVLAGPGTGKTTTLVEAVVDRVERRGLDPSAVLVLTFSRKAADELRTRINGRLGRTSESTMASTFHSFAYAMVRRFQPPTGYVDPLRLLSAPEQDARLSELLQHSGESSKADWPDALARALPTRGFAREVHAVMSRAREQGLDPEQLTKLGEADGIREWAAVGQFMEEYLQVLGLQGALDYSELVHAAVELAETPDVQAELRSTYQAVFVDEYQDTDPSQVRLLKALAGDGRDLVVVGDPDQSIYAFRGADVRGILDFPTDFARADGSPADVVALQTTRRFGSQLLAASRRVAAGIGASGAIPIEQFRRFRDPAAAGDHGDGRVDVFAFSSSGNEIAHIADLVRRAHLEDGVPWSEIAVLVRSGVRSIPSLRRGLVGAGVPVEVATDEVPLRLEPAVAPLLAALRVAAGLDELTVDAAQSLLASPLADLDAPALRWLGRELRRLDRAARLVEASESADPATAPQLAPPSVELLRDALDEPLQLADVEGWQAERVRRLGEILRKVRANLAGGATAEEALWQLWSGTPWPRRLRAAVERGGAAARTAHRDLDAVCALFEAAARAEEREDHTSPQVFLDEIAAQQIPADTLAERGVRGDAVRLLTAHRAKGLEWRLVVVASVQEGSWPDLRRRGSVLQADRLGPDGLTEPVPTSRLLAEERRLFYVAVTRARERLVVTAVASPEADGDQPSRLLGELGVEVVSRPGRPTRPISLAGLVAELRRVAGDQAVSEPMRHAAAARLARLTELRVRDEPVAPAADPATWWGLRTRSAAQVPVRPTDEPLTLSASSVNGIQECPLRWFLSREAAGESSRSSALTLGSIVHALAEHAAKVPEVTADQLLSWLDTVWPGVAHASPWIADRDHETAVGTVNRLTYWLDHNKRTLVGAEVGFETEVRLAGGDTAVLRGRIDRLERDDEGRLVVVDFKTSKEPTTKQKAAADPQLGLYQLVVEQGGLPTSGAMPHNAAPTESGGAELVYLRCGDDGGPPPVRRQQRQEPDDGGLRLIDRQLHHAAITLRSETFDGLRNDYCDHCLYKLMCPVGQPAGPVL